MALLFISLAFVLSHSLHRRLDRFPYSSLRPSLFSCDSFIVSLFCSCLSLSQTFTPSPHYFPLFLGLMYLQLLPFISPSHVLVVTISHILSPLTHSLLLSCLQFFSLLLFFSPLFFSPSLLLSSLLLSLSSFLLQSSSRSPLPCLRIQESKLLTVRSLCVYLCMHFLRYRYPVFSAVEMLFTLIFIYFIAAWSDPLKP